MRHFDRSQLVKPLQSKPWNSELYLVSQDYTPNAKAYPSSVISLIASYAIQCSLWNTFFLSNLHVQRPFHYPFPQPNETQYPHVTPFVHFK